MTSKSGSGKKSGSSRSGDAGDKDLIAELKNRIAVLENELCLRHDQRVLDTIEHKQTVEKLAEKEQFLRNTFECIQDGISVLDKDLSILEVNPAMEKWYGGHITGKKCYEAYHGRSKPCEPCPSIRAIKTGSTQTGIVHDLKGWRELYAFPLVNDRGEVTGVIEYVRDIDERKRAEEALKEAKAQAELYVDLMGHDINNMNQVSMGFLELAHNIIEMEGRLGEDNIVLLDKAMDSLKSSSQLIDSVRKIRQEKMGLYKPEVIDVGGMVEDAAKQFQSIPGRDIRITCDAPGHCLVRANALLKDVFINIVGNAVKHSRGALTITIEVKRVIDNGKTYCRVDVEDNGPGIPDTLKATLFDRLNLTSTRAKGKGFGLCLIKMLVDDYQGKFWVEDRIPGDHAKGARFVVMLPALEK